MLTPQEVSSHAFTKAVMGGYNMAMVDEFLDELTDDYTALYKENAALKAKMKVLVEKVEDYRATEDSMRATLLTAQKMADSIVREAEDKREQLIRDAQAQAQEKINELRREAADAQERLKSAQQQLTAFTQDVRAVCEREVAFLDRLPTLPVELQTPAAPTVPAAEIEQKILSNFQGEPAGQPEKKEEPADQPGPSPEQRAELLMQQAAARTAAAQQGAVLPGQPDQTAPEEPKPDYPAGNPFAPETDEPTRKMNLDDLKFGRNYSRGE